MKIENVGHIAGLDDATIDGAMPEVRVFAREAVRVVMLDMDGKVALLHIKSRDIYKLPGGGIQGEEELSQARDREISEETGHILFNVRKLGITTENRALGGTIQISHCYLARGIRQREPNFSADEREEGFELVWADNIDYAITLVSGSQPVTYDDRYINIRDTEILKAASQKMEILNNDKTDF